MPNIFLDLIHNAALLLTAAFCFDLLARRFRLRPGLSFRIMIGVLLGLLGCILIISPWTFVPGIVFDTRSVLLSITGLFFGTIPTVVAMALTTLFRLHLGGAAAWTGVCVILASGILGIAWRRLRRRPLREMNWTELYLFGIIVHLIMLGLMFTLPLKTALEVLDRISLPVMLIYPLATVLLGMLLVKRLRHEQAVTELLASQDRTRLFFERQIAGMAITSPTMEWLRVNDELCRMLGYSRQELTGLSWKDLTHPDDLPADLEQFGQLLAGDIDEYSLEKRFIRRDGSILWTVLSVGCVRLEDGSVDYILSLVVDITERKETEHELQLFKVLVESSSDAIGMSTPEGRHFYQNRAFTDLFGEIGEDPPATLYADREIGREVFRALMDGKRWEGEVEMYGRDGRVLNISLRAHANKNAAGKIMSLVGIHTDITQRKQMEKSLRDSEQRYRTLVNNLPGVAYRCLNDEHWTMLMFSDGANRLTGYPATDFINNAERSYASIIHPDDRAEVNCQVQKGVQARQPFEMEYRIVRVDGTIVWVYEKGQAIFAPTGELRWLEGVIIDITKQRTAYEEKERLHAQLVQAQKLESVGRLAGGVAHDFNNMLQAILGNADLALSEMNPDNPLWENFEEIRKAADRSARLTRQLLAFARKQTVNPQLVDLNDTVASMLKMLKRLIGEDIELVWQPGPDLWKIRIDSSQIDQLLANLVVNARDAIAGSGTISIRTANRKVDESHADKVPGMNHGEYVLLTFSDTGCGIEKKNLAHIFEPFFTTKEQDKGTGLGLATIYGIIKQNNGYIKVDSVPGQGTTFTIFLPRVRIEEKTGKTEAVQAEARGGTETILLVEDEKAILNLGTRILERLGYTVLSAETPEKALRIAREHEGEIHLLLTDVIMPEMNGRDLAEKMAAIRPEMKCLYMSGYAADVMASKGVLADNQGFIQKPFSLQNLAAGVREALQQ